MIPRSTYVSPEDYLEHERKAGFKSEYHKGEVFAMSGASEPHNAINESLSAEVYTRLKGTDCRSYSQDLRVNVSKNGLFTYPGLVVVCGEPKLLPDGYLDTLLNPTLIVEILSKSTGDYDRRTKFRLYRDLPEFKEYVLISSLEVYVERFFKGSNGWQFSEYRTLDDELPLESLSITLPVKDLYVNTLLG